MKEKSLKILSRQNSNQVRAATANWFPVIGALIGMFAPLTLFVIAAYGGHCPPSDPSREDCERATQTAKNPLIPLAGGLGGAAAGAALRGRRRRGPQVALTPEQGGGGALDGGPGDNPYTYFDGGQGPGQCGQGLPNYWVNTATLSLVVQDVVFVCQGLGPGIKLQLTYNSGLGKSGMLGAGWRFSYESAIYQTGEAILLWKGSGQGLHYRLSASSKNPDTPREAISQNGKSGRLLYYSQYWLFIETNTRLTYRYDKSSEVGVSRLSSISDLNGNSVGVTYNQDGTIAGMTDASGRSIHFSYDGQKCCTSFAVPNGRTAKFAYDGQGNLMQVVDLQGVITEYQYHPDHYLSRMIVGGSRKTTTFIYQSGVSAQGKHIMGIADAGGNTTRYEMASVNPRQVRVINPEGKITSYESTDEGHTKKITDPMGNAVEFGYAGGVRVSVQNRNHQITRMEYDVRGSLTGVTDPLGNSWSLAYDVNDNLISSTTPIGGTTRYTYDERHQLTRITSPMGNAATFNYDKKGQLIAVTDPTGHKSVFEYDLLGNLTSITSSLGDTTRIAYDTHGLTMKSMTDARGNTTRYEFDGNNRLTKVSHPDGATRTHVYDCCAGIATIDENGNKTEFVRGPLLHIEQFLDRMGNRTHYGYDRNGRLISALDALGRRLTLIYDDAGRMIQVTDPARLELKMNYDPAGNLLTLEDQRGKQSQFTFNARNLPTTFTNPLGQVNSITRDPLRRLHTWLNARGGKVSFAYDGDGRLSSESHDGVAVATFEYDTCGNLIAARDSAGETVYAYDARGRVTSIRYTGGLNLSFSYDPGGNISTITYPGGIVVTYSYDTRNRVARVTWGKSAMTLRYDAVGNRVGESRSNGTESTYRYDANRRLTEITHQSGHDKFAQITYRRDAAGDITGESAVLPLAPELGGMAVAATYNDANQIVSRGSDTYTYDADGNLIDISGGKWHAVYDAVNRPVEIRRIGQTTRYTYDALGQRRKTTNGSSVRKFYYDSRGRLMFETDESGRLKACHVYCGAALVARVNPNQESQFYHFDKTGNTLALTGADGKVSAAYAYSPFGAVMKTSGPAADNPFTFVGQYGVMDEGEGLFFMKNRYYDAPTGRFLQKDPVGFAGGINLYAYVGNNPVNHIDPSGLFVGGIIARMVGMFTKVPPGMDKELGEYFAGKALDVLIGAGLTIEGVDLVPANIRHSKAGYALDLLQFSGGYSGLSIARMIVAPIVEAGFTAGGVGLGGAAIVGLLSGAAVAATGVLAAAGGIEMGAALNSTYERFSGQSLGADFVDMVWDSIEARQAAHRAKMDAEPRFIDCAGPYLGYQ